VSNRYYEIKNGYYFGENFGLPGRSTIFVKIEENLAFLECYNHYYYQSYSFIYNDTLVKDLIDSNMFVSKNSIVYIKNHRIYYENLHQINSNYQKIAKTQLFFDPEKYSKIKNIINNNFHRL